MKKDMLDYLTKRKIIDMKRRGISTRRISKTLGINRETISKYWSEAQKKQHEMEQSGVDQRLMQEKVYATPRYAGRVSKRRKFTPELEKRLIELLSEEGKKAARLRWNKQKLTNTQIYEIIQEEGYDISLATINIELTRLRQNPRKPQVYIRQHYELGQRLEYDFCEVRLDLGDGVGRYFLAVFCAPASGFRWCYLYDNQKQKVFLDSHVKFFEMMNGVWSEVVYDNMRNVVAEFIGRNKKQLNSEIEKLASYYGFNIVTTNAYAGNEKGSVERSVEVLRNRIFGSVQNFDGMDSARKYMESCLIKINATIDIESEKQCLLPCRPPYELAEFCEARVSKYSFISVGGSRYSVPETLVGKQVSVKKYHDEIRVFFDLEQVACHKISKAKGSETVDIYHFLRTFERKPGALKNSVALKSIPKIKSIYDRHFSENPRKFIELLVENKGKDADELLVILERKIKRQSEIKAISVVHSNSDVDTKSVDILMSYSNMQKGGINNDN
jgi:transposase